MEMGTMKSVDEIIREAREMYWQGTHSYKSTEEGAISQALSDNFYLVEKSSAEEKIMSALEKDAKVKVLECSKLSGYCSEVEKCSKCKYLAPIAQSIIAMLSGEETK
jgi:uncharacterized protein YuzB (UPF0349 family)